MAKVSPTSEEYEKWEGGIRHKPTDIRISLACQNVRGEWTLTYFRGNAGEYDEGEVVQLGGVLLLGVKH